MIPKMIKLSEKTVERITKLAVARAEATGEKPNFSAVVRDLLLEALDQKDSDG